MRRIPLTEFAKEHGHTKAAQLLGCTQGALSKAIRVGRAVFVILEDDGSLSAEEQRPFPSQKSAAEPIHQPQEAALLLAGGKHFAMRDGTQVHP